MPVKAKAKAKPVQKQALREVLDAYFADRKRLLRLILRANDAEMMSRINNTLIWHLKIEDEIRRYLNRPK